MPRGEVRREASDPFVPGSADGLREAQRGVGEMCEIGGQLTLDWHLQQYAWHSHHHLAHITELRRAKGW